MVTKKYLFKTLDAFNLNLYFVRKRYLILWEITFQKLLGTNFVKELNYWGAKVMNKV